MINGIKVAKHYWKAYVEDSKYWTPSKYGLVENTTVDNIGDFHKLKIINADKYKFILTSDVWHLPYRDILREAQDIGIKVVFLPKESLNVYEISNFGFKEYLKDEQCYFTPDLVLSPGAVHYDLWKDKTKSVITGHPRFNYCLDKGTPNDKKILCSKYKLEQDKKLIFFPSYPIFHQNNVGLSLVDKKSWKDFFEEREEMMETLLSFAESRSDVQVVVKLHPMTTTAFRKRLVGTELDMTGLTKRFLDNPTSKFKVIDGARTTKLISIDIVSGSDIVVGRNSTMLIEAALMGKPVLRAEFEKTDRIISILGYKDVFDTAVGRSAALKKLKNIVSNPVKNFNDNDLSKYIYKVDGKCCERICTAIKNII